MGFLVNELSLHGQFTDLVSFKAAIGRLMKIRETVRGVGRELHCHKRMAQAFVMQDMRMPQAIAALAMNEQRALMSWLTQHGPFWMDQRQHGSGDYLECKRDIVTDTAVGEAAWCRFMGIDRELVSIAPSAWEFSPITVDLIVGTDEKKTIDVANHWELADFEEILRVAPIPLSSWAQLAQQAVSDCSNLTFSADAFTPFDGHPFVPGGAKQMLTVLARLNHFRSCFDENGQRTPEGNEMYQNFFTGSGAIFTDSSDSEKTKFKNEMTFRHPGDADKTLFCTWHGKVKTGQLRVHFSYPARADEPLYIVYLGPKITKQ
jgi:hypothetical protein